MLATTTPPKLYIQSTINISKKLLGTANWANKKWTGIWLGRLACTSSRTQIF